MLPHIVPGSTVVRDMEKSHGAPIGAAGCSSEAHRADVRDPACLECMALVNNLCSWLKRHLWHLTGTGPGNLQLYLDRCVYLFRVNQAKEKVAQSGEGPPPPDDGGGDLPHVDDLWASPHFYTVRLLKSNRTEPS